MDILLVDDHPLFREGLALVLKLQLNIAEADVNVLEADSAKTALEAVQQHNDLDLILLDLHLPDNQDFSLLQQIKSFDPSIPVAMLSANEDAQKIQQALQQGASGFITKSSKSSVMISAIQLILAGGIYVPPAILKANLSGESKESGELAENTANTAHSNAANIFPPNTTDDTVIVQLTERQKEVLLLMDDGLSNKEIAKVLTMSPSTVKVHVAAILRACNVNNRTQAVSFARTHHLL
ncbi:MAG: response regulator transcription factor [Pseudomonadales bacterium]|nr:response regulator transcription factor [Pseudomonadales bacterium]